MARKKHIYCKMSKEVVLLWQSLSNFFLLSVSAGLSKPARAASCPNSFIVLQGGLSVG